MLASFKTRSMTLSKVPVMSWEDKLQKVSMKVGKAVLMYSGSSSWTDFTLGFCATASLLAAFSLSSASLTILRSCMKDFTANLAVCAFCEASRPRPCALELTAPILHEPSAEVKEAKYHSARLV